MNAIQKSICLKIKHLGESGRKQVAMWLEKKIIQGKQVKPVKKYLETKKT